MKIFFFSSSVLEWIPQITYTFFTALFNFYSRFYPMLQSIYFIFLLISLDTFNSTALVTATAHQFVAFSMRKKMERETNKNIPKSFTDNELNHVAVNQQLIVYNMRKGGTHSARSYNLSCARFSSLLSVCYSIKVVSSESLTRWYICCLPSSMSFWSSLPNLSVFAA